VRTVQFKRLEIVAGGPEAARSLFEDLIVDLVGAQHPGAHSIRANPGDWGIDAVVGRLETAGAVHVWQAKYFPDGIGEGQKAQIRNAYQQALKAAGDHGHELESWTLCVPCLLDGPEMSWWNQWKGRQRDGVDIDLWAENHLRAKVLAPEAAWIYDAYLTEGTPPPSRRLEDLKDLNEYEGTLFIRQLHHAGLTARVVLDDAKRAYFNAELVAADMDNREFGPGQHELQLVRNENRAIWASEFAGASSNAPEDGRLAEMYGAVTKELRKHHTQAPAGPLRLHFVHRNGIMHQLVDEGDAGWTVDYEEVAREHIS